jgi:hypothetical protein
MSSDRKGSGESEQTLEQQFTDLYFDALRSLQKLWLGDTAFSEKKFQQQVFFLIRLLPNKKEQMRIIQAWDKEITELKLQNLKKEEIQFYAGLGVVTETVLFIGQAFDLINEDITAPATSKEYRRAELEIPEQGEMNDRVPA